MYAEFACTADIDGDGGTERNATAFMFLLYYCSILVRLFCVVQAWISSEVRPWQDHDKAKAEKESAAVLQSCQISRGVIVEVRIHVPARETP